MYRMYGMSREAWMPVATMYRMYGMSREAWMPVATMYRMYRAAQATMTRPGT